MLKGQHPPGIQNPTRALQQARVPKQLSGFSPGGLALHHLAQQGVFHGPFAEVGGSAVNLLRHPECGVASSVNCWQNILSSLEVFLGGTKFSASEEGCFLWGFSF